MWILILLLLIIIVFLLIFSISLLKIMNETIINTEKLKIRYEGYYNILNIWIRINDNKLLEYFLKNKIKTIAIYGCGNLGQILFEKLKTSNIEMKYFIDKNKNDNRDFKVFNLEEIKNNIDVDAVIVTPIDYYQDINTEIQRKDYKGHILSLEEIILEIYNERK